MENKDRISENMSKNVGRASESMERAAETMGDTIIAVLDRLAGKKSDLKLSFEDLTFDTGVFKARMNGAVILETTMAKETTSAA
jgi:hypothetical protein